MSHPPSKNTAQHLQSEIATVRFSAGDDTSDDETVRTSSSGERNVCDKAILAKVERFNPFDTDTDNQQLDHEQNGIHHRHGNDDMEDETLKISLSEDHFSLPDGLESELSVTQLEHAINRYKNLVTQSVENSEAQKNFVTKLVELRYQLTHAKEGTQLGATGGVRQVLGHHFALKESVGAKHYCEQCSTIIWGVMTQWYRCIDCGYCSHIKCLNALTRTCAAKKVQNNPNFILNICPEKGLASQNYACHECRTAISYQRGYAEPRRCDYTGSYYCSNCHWNDAVAIPARVLHNWDFEPRKVCRASKQFLRLMLSRSVLRVQDINPMLFVYVQELNDVKKLREEILIMKQYFLSCQDALKTKLLLQLQSRQHFVENSDMYSLRDLMDVAADELLPKLASIHASFAQHIKTDCSSCQSKGSKCALCDDKEALFPFDNHAIVCAKCSTVLHRHCYFRRQQQCPGCDQASGSLQTVQHESATLPHKQSISLNPFEE